MSVSPSTLKVLPVILLVVGLLVGAGGMYTYFQRQLAKNELLTVLNQVSRLEQGRQGGALPALAQ